MTLDLTLIEQLEQFLPAYLASRRWFRSKSLTISHVGVRNIIEAGGFLILLLNVHYSQGGEDLYLLPTTSATSPNSDELHDDPILTFQSPEGNSVAVYDAVSSPFFRTVLFRALTTGGTLPGTHGSLVAKSSVTLPEPEGILQSTVSRAEQSNTSIIYGQEFILKIFRKLEAGINPDIEIGAFLTAQGFKNTPAVLATLEYRPNEGESFSAAILQQFVPNQGDAWKYTLQSLAAFFQRALHSSLNEPDLLGDYLASAKLLGIRTAQMHAALSASTNNPDFTPEPFTSTDAQALSREVSTQAQTSLNLLRDKLSDLAPADQQLAQQVLDLEIQINKRFIALAALATSAKRVRSHGDYHLGQVLYTGSDFMIIDFEGEPARPLSERRGKALALRDVAGMLRSFQYAAYAGLYGLLPDLPSDPHSTEKLAACSALWYQQASDAYLTSYFAQAGSQIFLPQTTEQRNFFLEAFLLQKALYEVQYELNNRPRWVGIPLRGILSLMETK